MKYIGYLLLPMLAVWTACHLTKRTPKPSFQIFPITSSVRALEAVDANTVWYAGSGGQFGYTENGGQSWYIDSIRIGDTIPEFRAIAVTPEAMFLLSIGSPARLYKSTDKGRNWTLVYRENHPDCFYDAMTFWDSKNGIAIGDPTDGCLSIIQTSDGGDTWHKIPCSALPSTETGEFAFAASNTNISLHGQHAWIATGGVRARVLHSPDHGRSWEIFGTPIRQGGQMTGIFSMDFYDEKLGVVIGGDWQNQALNTQNKAITRDGGKTWQLIADGREPGYRSCVQFVPGSGGRELIAVGMPGISWSGDGGENWELLSRDTFYTIRLVSSGKTAWLAGPGKVGRMSW